MDSSNSIPLTDKTEYDALELFRSDIQKIPKLWDPFLQTVGLASLVGTSDSGKSTFLRQLALSLALGNDKYLGYNLNPKHKRVIYISTEENPLSVAPILKKQVEYYKNKGLVSEEINLKNLTFIFDTHNLLENLTKKLESELVDLVIIDAFTDIFSKEINANTQVRSFLNSYDQLAKKHRCLILFLHHTGKRTGKYNPSKESIIGSQAFEAKMRVVLELRPRAGSGNNIDLWVLKSNFLNNSHKKESYVLSFQDGIFENTEIRASTYTTSKVNNLNLINKIKELRELDENISIRDIEKKLEGTKLQAGKSTIHLILKGLK